MCGVEKGKPSGTVPSYTNRQARTWPGCIRFWSHQHYMHYTSVLHGPPKNNTTRAAHLLLHRTPRTSCSGVGQQCVDAAGQLGHGTLQGHHPLLEAPHHLRSRGGEAGVLGGCIRLPW